MEGQLVWFLLAGFLLGFACSTLWEWFYYRGVRRRILAAQTEVASSYSAQPVMTPAIAANEPSVIETGYRSPAVFIEGEEQNLDQPASLQPTYEPVTEPRVAAPDAAHLAASEVGEAAESTDP